MKRTMCKSYPYSCFYYQVKWAKRNPFGGSFAKAHRFCKREQRDLESPRRPPWCPIKIIPIEEVRQVLDAKEKLAQ